MVKCPEDPVALLGQPIGMYHCPVCGCMQVGGVAHQCDPDECLLLNCDCLPPGVIRSANALGWEVRKRVDAMCTELQSQGIDAKWHWDGLDTITIDIHAGAP